MNTVNLDNIYTTLEKVELFRSEDEKFILQSGSRMFYIGDTLYTILGSLQQKKDISTICDQLNREKGISIGESHLQQIISDNIGKLKLDTNTDQPDNLVDSYQKGSYIFLQIPIMKEKMLNIVTRPLTFLFSRYAFTAMLLAGLLATTYILFQIDYGQLFTQKNIAANSNILVLYTALTIAMFLHEMGHAVACRKYDIMPQSIGFGFYLIFPVFYTDVSKVWRISRNKRVLVNIGGVYFQLIVNLFFLVAYLALQAWNLPGKSMIELIVIINTSIAAYSLNPFLRNDGYWMYADYFDLPNLMSNSIYYPYYVYLAIRGKDGKRGNERKLARSIPLAIYSLLNYAVFTVLTVYCYFYFKNHLIPGITYLLNDSQFPHNLYAKDNIFFTMKVFFTAFIYGFIIYRSVRFIHYYLKNKLWKA
jgi:putative peptide zinc metalloprotease protein